MIQLKDLSLAFGERIIFDDITITFRNQKIGLVGRNGAGKTTLLKIIAGKEKPDSGSVIFERGKKIAYMPQELVVTSQKNVFDEAFATFDAFISYEDEKHKIEAELERGAGNSTLLARYEQIVLLLQSFDKEKALARTKEILVGVGFNQERMAQPVMALSTGWQMRLVLAKLLLQDADFYLFDEPTNHLDMVSKEWFFEFLTNFEGGFLMATHDRHFLNSVCDHIFQIERGNGTMFVGNFDQYVEQKDIMREEKMAARARQDRDIAHRKAIIDKFRAKPSKSKMAKSMEKKLEKIDLIEIEPALPKLTIQLPQVERAGKIVLLAKNLSYRFGEKVIFQNVNAEILRTQKVALVAANGVGKTTLFNVLSGKYPLQTGSVDFGYNVHYAVFEQDQMKVLKPDNTIFEEVCESVSAPESQIRAMLGAFLFTGDDVTKKIKVLSGGERNRVAMVKVFLQNANFLMLDEPTNHLDLHSKEILLQALQNYTGTLLFVSHDHDFTQKLANRIFELTPHGLNTYEGTYESYLWTKRQNHIKADAQQTPLKKVVKQEKNNAREQEKEFKRIERTIEQVEKSLAKVSEQLAEAEHGSLAYNQLLKKITLYDKELQELNAAWQKLYEEME